MKQLKIKDILKTLNSLIENEILTGEELIGISNECCSSECRSISIQTDRIGGHTIPHVCFDNSYKYTFLGVSRDCDKEIFDKFIKSLFVVSPSAIINDIEGVKVSWLPDEFVATFEFYYDDREATFTFTMVEDRLSQIQFISNEEDMVENIERFNGLMITAMLGEK